MALARLLIVIHEILNKYTDIFPEKYLLIIFDSNYAVCMAKNGKGAKYTRHISRIVKFVKNGKKCKMDKIDWCEGGL